MLAADFLLMLGAMAADLVLLQHIHHGRPRTVLGDRSCPVRQGMRTENNVPAQYFSSVRQRGELELSVMLCGTGRNDQSLKRSR